MQISFCGQAYTDRSVVANAQRSVNLYPMHSPTPDNPERVIMYPTPGYSLFKDTSQLGIPGTGEIRGFFQVNDTLYFISGSRLIKATSDSTFTAEGTLNTSNGRCSIVCNTVELAISDGAYGYTYNLSSGAFAQIPTTGGFPATGGVTNFTYIDGYVLASPNNSTKVIQSNVLDAKTWDAQAFVNQTSYPDHNVAVFSDQNQLYFFGPKLAEVRADVGSFPFAFQKVQAVLIQAGCAAKESLVKVGSTIIWLAADQAGKAYVAALEGYNPKVLSTAPINEIFERYATISDAFAYTYREADNQFYVITFPSEGATWAVELKTGMWHERSVAGGKDLPTQYVTWLGKHLVGDSNGKLWWMSQDYSTDQNGDGLTRIRAASHVIADGNTIFVDELFVDMETGVGTLDGQGQNPLATLSISRDGGHTWVDVGTQPIGAMGDYKKRLTWRRLGRARTRITAMLTITDPVGTYIMGAYAKARAGWK